jgi:hypothetical protein
MIADIIAVAAKWVPFFRRHWLQMEAAHHPVCEAGVDPSSKELQHKQAD